MIAVYIAGAIQGENIIETLHNINHGVEWTARLRQLGYSPFPVFEDFMDIMRADVTIEQVYEASIVWLKRADVMFVVPGYERSQGTQAEIDVARESGIPVFFDLERLADWNKEKA